MCTLVRVQTYTICTDTADSVDKVCAHAYLLYGDQHVDVTNDVILVTSCTQISSAYYGVFFENCGQECCLPSTVRDCQEHVETSNPQDWTALLLTCDNQTRCDVLNTGGFAASCEPPTAEYLLVNYNCTPSKFLAYFVHKRNI